MGFKAVITKIEPEGKFAVRYKTDYTEETATSDNIRASKPWTWTRLTRGQAWYQKDDGCFIYPYDGHVLSTNDGWICRDADGLACYYAESKPYRADIPPANNTHEWERIVGCVKLSCNRKRQRNCKACGGAGKFLTGCGCDRHDLKARCETCMCRKCRGEGTARHLCRSGHVWMEKVHGDAPAPKVRVVTPKIMKSR